MRAKLDLIRVRPYIWHKRLKSPMSRITTERVTPKGCVRETGFYTRFVSKTRLKKNLWTKLDFILSRSFPVRSAHTDSRTVVVPLKQRRGWLGPAPHGTTNSVAVCCKSTTHQNCTIHFCDSLSKENYRKVGKYTGHPTWIYSPIALVPLWEHRHW